MALDIQPGSTYRDFTLEPKIHSINLSEQTESIITVGDTMKNNLSSENENKNEPKDKNTDSKINLLKSTVDDVNNKLRFRPTKCEFTYYEDIDQVAVKIVDGDTEEIIREIPTEKAMDLIRSLREFAGLIIDEKR